MTSDKELLELAAKAAGNVFNTEQGYLEREDLANGLCIGTRKWNPLASDGDALRLAVKLKFGILVCSGIVCVETAMDKADAEELLTDDPYAATRRAIVRAAAEIGKEKK